jgi:hypothetical protein
MICVMDRALSSCDRLFEAYPQDPQKWRHGDSNPRHPACKAGALPTELYPQGLPVHLPKLLRQVMAKNLREGNG